MKLKHVILIVLILSALLSFLWIYFMLEVVEEIDLSGHQPVDYETEERLEDIDEAETSIFDEFQEISIEAVERRFRQLDSKLFLYIIFVELLL